MKSKRVIDPYHVPADYAEWFRMYRRYTEATLSKVGIGQRDIPDVASEIMARFVERDMLALFDPTMMFEYQGEPRPARFQSFYSAFVRTYAKGYNERVHRHQTRFGVSLQQEIEDGITLENVLSEKTQDTAERFDEVEFNTVISSLRKELEGSRISRVTASKVTCADLLDVAATVATYPELLAEVRRRYGISHTASCSWVGKLRESLRPHLTQLA